MNGREKIAVAVTVGSVALVAFLSMALPGSFFLFCVNYASWLPLPVQIAWAAAVLAAMAAAMAFRNSPWLDRVARAALYAAAALACMSFFVWRTPYPTLHGDGPAGYHALDGWANLRPALPQSFARMDRWALDAPTCDPIHRDLTLDRATIRMVVVFGALAVLCALMFLRSIEQDPVVRLGLFLLVVSAPAMAGGYGHYDGYTESVFFQLLWWGALCLSARGGGTPRGGPALLIVLALLAFSVHPLNLILVAYTGYLLWFQRRGIRLGDRARSVAGVGFAVLLGLAPLLMANNALTTRQTTVPLGLYLTPYLWRFLHLKLSSFLLAAFPAAVAFISLCVITRTRPMSSPDPLTHLAGVAFLNVFILMFTLGMDLGVADEFLYGLPGTAALGSVVILSRRVADRMETRTVLFFGLLSLYLFVPKVWVNAGPRCVDRFGDLYPQDQCLHNVRISPYLHLALSLPVDRAEDRSRCLAILMEGVNTPIPYWRRYSPKVRGFYVAWAYAFGRTDAGRDALKRILTDQPQLAPSLWVDGVAYTDRYAPDVAARIRRDSRRLLQANPGSVPPLADQKLLEILSGLEHGGSAGAVAPDQNPHSNTP